MVITPLQRSIIALATGNDSNLLTTGDSTCEGLFDSPVIYSTAGAGYGWEGVFGARIGAALDINVKYVFMTISYTPDFYTALGWDTAKHTIHTSSQGDSAPTLTIYNGGTGGAYLDYIETCITNVNLLLNAAPEIPLDLIIISGGCNDVSRGVNPVSFAAKYRTLINNIKTARPDVPIIATTQNQTLYNQTAMQNTWTALANDLTGLSWPLSAPLAETNISGTYFLDTYQAFDGYTLSTILAATSGPVALHPNHSGYVIEGDWIGDQLIRNLTAGTYNWSSTATGVSEPWGNASSSYTWVSSARGTVPIIPSSKLPWKLPFEIGGPLGHSTGTYALDNTATEGNNARRGAASGQYIWDSKASGGFITPSSTLPWTIPFILGANTLPDYGGTTGTYTWAATTFGKTLRKATATAGFKFAGSSAGESAYEGHATGTLHWTATTTGSTDKTATAGGAYTWTGAATSSTEHDGTNSSTYTWTATATGQTPSLTTKTGHGAGTLTWAGTANGRTPLVGTKSGYVRANYLFTTNTASGKSFHRGHQTSTWRWASTSSGAAPIILTYEGTGTGTYRWTATTTGTFQPFGTTHGTYNWAASLIAATGKMVLLDTPDGGIALADNPVGSLILENQPA